MRRLALLLASLTLACKGSATTSQAPRPTSDTATARSAPKRPAEPNEIPACRLDGSQAAAVKEAYEVIRVHWEQTGPRALPWRQVAVNGAGGDDALQVQLVTDAFENQVDARGCHKQFTGMGRLDRHTISGVCHVVDPGAIHCSAGAVRALIDSDPHGRRPNPALVMLLAHEVSHLVHRDPPARYTSALRPISLGAPEPAKWQALVSACRAGGDPQKLARETRADEEAVSLIERFVKATADADAQAAPADTRAFMLGSLEASLSGLRQWQAGWFGRRDLPPTQTPNIDDDPEALARWAADRWLCQVLETGEGQLLVPQVASEHPIASVRLAQLSGRVARMVLPEGRGSLLEQIGNAQDLLHKTAIAIALVDEAEATADVLRTRRFCENVRWTRAPDCARIPATFPRAGKKCPEVDGGVTWKPLSAEGESAAVKPEGGHTRLDVGTVNFARPLSDGTVLIGAHGRIGFLREDRLSLFDVPCLPRDVVETPEGALLACDHPLGLVRTSRAAPLEFGRAHVVFQGEPDVDTSQLLWLGQVGARTLTLFRSGSGKTQTIDVTHDQWTTALPWQGQGCEVLVHGMTLGLTAGRLSGTNLGQPSIHRTARFDDALTRAISFTARADLKPLACGLGPSSPLCLTPDGQLVDPEPEKVKTVARLQLGDLVKTGNLRAAALCVAGARLYALVQMRRHDGNSIVELHEVHEGRSQRLLREEYTEEVALRCTGEEATVSVSNGIGTALWRFRAASH